MEISIPLFITLLNKRDAVTTPVTHFRSCIDSALFNLCRDYSGHRLTLCCRLSKSKPFIVILLHFRALNNLRQKNNHPQELAWVEEDFTYEDLPQISALVLHLRLKYQPAQRPAVHLNDQWEGDQNNMPVRFETVLPWHISSKILCSS